MGKDDATGMPEELPYVYAEVRTVLTIDTVHDRHLEGEVGK